MSITYDPTGPATIVESRIFLLTRGPIGSIFVTDNEHDKNEIAQKDIEYLDFDHGSDGPLYRVFPEQRRK